MPHLVRRHASALSRCVGASGRSLVRQRSRPRTAAPQDAHGAGEIAWAAATLGAGAAFAAIAASRTHDRLLTAPNLVTMSRGFAAAALAGQAASRSVRVGVWVALVLSCTVADWIDGPLARHYGTTRLGALLDLEADSWLTLWAAIAAWRAETLPALSLLPAAIRYPVFVFAQLCRQPRKPEPGTGAVFERFTGTLQMVVLVAALAPSKRVRRQARRFAPLAATAQLGQIAVVTVRSLT
jgi:CDP-diacylglycerol--glycerol-3-phosphate 3-phosphatidyltransferase